MLFLSAFKHGWRHSYLVTNHSGQKMSSVRFIVKQKFQKCINKSTNTFKLQNIEKLPVFSFNASSGSVRTLCRSCNNHFPSRDSTWWTFDILIISSIYRAEIIIEEGWCKWNDVMIIHTVKQLASKITGI